MHSGSKDTINPANSYAQPTSLVVNDFGTVYARGYSDGDYATIKYIQTTITDVSCGKKGDTGRTGSWCIQY